MPFTISHIAIVVPFTCRPHKYLSATGLIIGSMVPDFLYFILLNPYFNGGHQWWGIFVYDIPLSLLLAFLYHNGVKPALISQLPAWAGNRIGHFRSFNWDHYFQRHYLVVIASVILGVLSHFFLDAFTHGDGYFVGLLPFLQQDVSLFAHPMKMWYLLQYISSIAGLLIILYFFLKIPAKHNSSKSGILRKLGYWLLVAVFTVIILLFNHQFHYIKCEGADYLAVIMGGFFYSYFVVMMSVKKLTSPSTINKKSFLQ
ncbi:DUF4184 family protein [Chitinophaga sp. MM2321]|uniref:DUF4184 family protein n=1 Tax=Chitinophaga sp. MM2321 TaxID=3137178 RepID=UPI0032D5936E